MEFQSTIRRSLPRNFKKKAESIRREVIRRTRVELVEEITVRVVGRKLMRRYNRDYKGHDYETDVLAFETGDILISYDAANTNAPKYDHTLEQELYYLLTHALLHLAGRRDASEAERESMNRETEAILNVAL